MAQDQIDRDGRIKFMNITEEARRLLPEFWRFLDPKLDEILDGFYKHVTSVPSLAKMIGDQTWHYPSSAECLECHTDGGGRTLGPTMA